MGNNRLKDDLEYVLVRTEKVWKELKNCRLFITGGTGFFGSWLLETFAWANSRLKLDASAIVLSRNPEKFEQRCPHLYNDSSIGFHRGDITDFDFPTGEFSHIIHAATELAPGTIQNDPIKVLNIIMAGTQRVLDFAQKSNTKKLLLTSSGAVYGKQPSNLEHVSETYLGAPDCTDPSQVYGVGKRASELLCCAYAKQFGFEVKIARCFAFVGPYLPIDAHYAIGNFIRDALAKDTIQINGDGSPFRSYMYASDLMVALWNILVTGISRKAYNVGSDCSVTIEQVAHTVAECINNCVSVRIREKTKEGIAAQRYVPSIDRLRTDELLGELIPLKDSILKTITWHHGHAIEKQGKRD